MGDFRLSEEELKKVMQRAIELDTTERRQGGAWDLAAIEELGAEIGVSPAAIKAAWVEASTTGAPIPFHEHLADPNPMELVRVVPDSPKLVLSHASAWLHDAGFEVVRHSDHAVLLRRRRKARSRLPGIGQVVVDVRPLPSESPESFVRISLARKRGERQHLGRQALDGARTWAIADGAVVLVSGTVTLLHGLIALPAVLAGGAAVGWWRARGQLRRTDGSARLEVAGLLDLLEHRHPGALGPGY